MKGQMNILRVVDVDHSEASDTLQLRQSIGLTSTPLGLSSSEEQRHAILPSSRLRVRKIQSPKQPRQAITHSPLCILLYGVRTNQPGDTLLLEPFQGWDYQ